MYLEPAVVLRYPKSGSATTSAAEVKQAARHLHHKVIKALLDVAKNRGHNVEDLDTTQGVFHANPFLADRPIFRFLFGGYTLAEGEPVCTTSQSGGYGKRNHQTA